MTTEPASDSTARAESPSPRAFTTTHWSLVARAGTSATADSREALETLCQTYWYPLYAFARRAGWPAGAAEDATQGFFEHLLATDMIGKADRARGKFRTFLLSSFRNFLAHEHARATARKRGGGREIVPVEAMLRAEDRLTEEPACHDSPEALFDRHWALGTIDAAFTSLRNEYQALGKAELFDSLKAVLWGEAPGLPYAQLARQHGLSEGAVKMSALRLRRRVREALHAEVAKTLLDPTDVESELQHLLAALGP